MPSGTCKKKKSGCPTEHPLRRGWSRSPAAMAMGMDGVCSEVPVEQSKRPLADGRLSVPQDAEVPPRLLLLRLEMELRVLVTASPEPHPRRAERELVAHQRLN